MLTPPFKSCCGGDRGRQSQSDQAFQGRPPTAGSYYLCFSEGWASVMSEPPTFDPETKSESAIIYLAFDMDTLAGLSS